MANSKKVKMLVITVENVSNEKREFTVREEPENVFGVAKFTYCYLSDAVSSALKDALYQMNLQKKTNLSIKFSF